MATEVRQSLLGLHSFNEVDNHSLSEKSCTPRRGLRASLSRLDASQTQESSILEELRNCNASKRLNMSIRDSDSMKNLRSSLSLESLPTAQELKINLEQLKDKFEPSPKSDCGNDSSSPPSDSNSFQNEYNNLAESDSGKKDHSSSDGSDFYSHKESISDRQKSLGILHKQVKGVLEQEGYTVEEDDHYFTHKLLQSQQEEIVSIASFEYRNSEQYRPHGLSQYCRENSPTRKKKKVKKMSSFNQQSIQSDRRNLKIDDLKFPLKKQPIPPSKNKSIRRSQTQESFSESQEVLALDLPEAPEQQAIPRLQLNVFPCSEDADALNSEDKDGSSSFSRNQRMRMNIQSPSFKNQINLINDLSVKDDVASQESSKAAGLMSSSTDIPNSSSNNYKGFCEIDSIEEMESSSESIKKYVPLSKRRTFQMIPSPIEKPSQFFQYNFMRESMDKSMEESMTDFSQCSPLDVRAKFLDILPEMQNSFHDLDDNFSPKAIQVKKVEISDNHLQEESKDKLGLRLFEQNQDILYIQINDLTQTNKTSDKCIEGEKSFSTMSSSKVPDTPIERYTYSPCQMTPVSLSQLPFPTPSPYLSPSFVPKLDVIQQSSYMRSLLPPIKENPLGNQNQLIKLQEIPSGKPNDKLQTLQIQIQNQTGEQICKSPVERTKSSSISQIPDYIPFSKSSLSQQTFNASPVDNSPLSDTSFYGNVGKSVEQKMDSILEEKRPTHSRVNYSFSHFESFSNDGINYSRSCSLIPEIKEPKTMLAGNYSGEMKDGKKEGQGKMEYIDGSYYVGGFKDDVKSGFGKQFSLFNQIIYEGQFLNNKYEGIGQLKNPTPITIFNEYSYEDFTKLQNNWLSYAGQFKDGEMSGSGQLKLTNSEYYEGSFSNNIPCGYGTFYTINGKQIEGYWRNGLLESNPM